MLFLLLNVCHSCYVMEVSFGDLKMCKMPKLGLTVNLKCIIRTSAIWDSPLG